MQCEARRKFIEAQKTDLARATAALAFYRELYAIERAIKEEIAKTAPEDKADESERAAIRLRIRQEKAVPVLERFREWLEAQKPDALPKSPFGIAIGYHNCPAISQIASSGYADQGLTLRFLLTQCLKNRGFLEYRHAKNLQNFPQRSRVGARREAGCTR